jgi:hypothetical protein
MVRMRVHGIDFITGLMFAMVPCDLPGETVLTEDLCGRSYGVAYGGSNGTPLSLSGCTINLDA